MDPYRDDDLEQQLRGRLRRSADRLPAPDLLGGSRDRIARVRRRRRAGIAVAAAAIAVAIPVGIVTSSGLGQGTHPAVPPSAVPSSPAPSPSTPSASAPAGDPTKATTTNVRLDKLEKGSDPTVGYVSEGVWHQPDGTETSLTVGAPNGNNERTFVAFGGGLVSVSAEPSNENEPPQVRLVAPDGTDRALDVGPATDFTAGPDGSVVWVERADPYAKEVELHRLDSSGEDKTLGVYAAAPDEGFFTLAVTDGFAFFDRTGSSVTKVALDSGTDEKLDGWSKVLAADPSGQRVALADEDGCPTVLDAASLETHTQMCNWEPKAFSPGGDVVLAGHRDDPERAALLDARTGAPLVHLKGWGEGSRPTVAFDDRRNVHFMGVRDPSATDVTVAVVSCTPQGACHRATAGKKSLMNSGVHPFEMIIPAAQ